MSISFSARWNMGSETESNKYAYISAYRKGGFGVLDIYRVTFSDVENQLTAIRGQIRQKVLFQPHGICTQTGAQSTCHCLVAIEFVQHMNLT